MCFQPGMLQSTKKAPESAKMWGIMSTFRNFLLLRFALLCPCLLVAAPGLAENGSKQVYKKLLPLVDAAAPEEIPTRVLKGKIGQSVVLKMQDVGNPWGYVPFGNKFPQQVSQVVAHSPAYQAGLRAGDYILKGQLMARSADLVVERNHKEYSCVIKLDSNKAQQGTASASGSGEKNSKSSLSSHYIVLLVDSSASMNTKDCPDGLSRWEWCRKQAADLYKDGKAPTLSQINISTFNSTLRLHNNCKIDDLSKIFQQNIPEGETNMAPALEDAVSSVNSQLYSGKPAVLAVITDGRPTDVEAVKKRIIQTTNSFRDPSLLTIVFIEIGNPERYLSEFDNDLVKQGAKQDIVSVFPFATVNSQGLAKTLSQAIDLQQAAAAKTPAPINEPKKAVKPQAEAAAEADPDAEPAKPINKAVAKPSSQELEQQRLAREKKLQEESKVRRAAANNTYDFSKKSNAPSPNHSSTPVPSAPAKPVTEVDEKESVRRQQSNRSYGDFHK